MTISGVRDLLSQETHFPGVRSPKSDNSPNQTFRDPDKVSGFRYFMERGQWSIKILSAAEYDQLMYFPIPSDLFWKHAPAGRPGGQYPVHCSFTCVPGKSSFALLIIIFVQEDLRSSAIVSPPFPIMWPETLLEKTTIMFFSFQCLNKTWVQAS